MKDQIQPHELCAYLPYEVEVKRKDGETACLIGMHDNIVMLKRKDGLVMYRGLWNNKLLLRPLSDLTKEIDHNGERFVPVDFLDKIAGKGEPFVYFQMTNIEDDKFLKFNPFEDIGTLPYWAIKKLLEWHFDVFNLLDRGMAERKID